MAKAVTRNAGRQRRTLKELPSPNAFQFRPFQRIEIVTEGQEERGLILLWLQTGGFALMREDDHEAFKTWLGFGDDETVNYYRQADGKAKDKAGRPRGRQYVYATHKDGKGVSVGKWLVFQRRTKRRVTFANGNPFDLRRGNVRAKSAKPIAQD